MICADLVYLEDPFSCFKLHDSCFCCLDCAKAGYKCKVDSLYFDIKKIPCLTCPNKEKVTEMQLEKTIGKASFFMLQRRLSFWLEVGISCPNCRLPAIESGKNKSKCVNCDLVLCQICEKPEHTNLCIFEKLKEHL